MSGGSFQYLGLVYDATSLYEKRHQLADMRDALATGYDATDAARETERVLATIRQFEVIMDVAIERLRPVWQAVEWHCSGDWGRDDVVRALATYRASLVPDSEAPAPPRAPRPSQPRVVRDSEGRLWRVNENGYLQWRTEGLEWGAPGVCVVDAERVALWADLYARPTEEVVGAGCLTGDPR